MIKYFAILCLLLFYLEDSSAAVIVTDKIKPLTIEVTFESFSTTYLSTGLLDAVQIQEIDSVELLGNSLKDLFTIILVILSVIIMMITPLVLIYSTFDDLFNFRETCQQIKHWLHSKQLESATKNHHEIPNDVFQICLQFYVRFMGYGLGLFSWVGLSLVYMFWGFENFSKGLKEYFYFPFEIMNALIRSDFINSLSDYQQNWLYMLLIVVITFLLFLLGKIIGNVLGKQEIHKRCYNSYSKQV